MSVLKVANKSSPNYFMVIDPSYEVSNYLNMHGDYYDFVVRERVSKPETLSDIYDGKCYKDFVDKLPVSKKYSYSTACFNSDGAAVYESSTFSIWPIYLMLNEIPLEYRFKSIIVSGLYFGKHKPDMNTFLRPFVNTMNKLLEKGISCTIKNEKKNIYLYSLVGAVDGEARYDMNGTTRSNGNLGCDWCMHPGHYHDGCLLYTYDLPKHPLRDQESFLNNILEAAASENTIDGIKYASALSFLENFDFVNGMVQDYMHCFLLGIGRQFTNYLLNSLSRNQYEILDLIFKKFTACHQIGRLARPLSEKSKWNAREYENWILYYSIPLLELFVERKKLNNWSKFVNSLYILLKSEIKTEELEESEKMLDEFAKEAQEIYGERCMTFQVHQAADHICESVRNWGPVWAHNCFYFEGAHRDLLNSIHSANGVTLQILRFINMQHTLKIVENYVYSEAHLLTKVFCDVLEKEEAQMFDKTQVATYPDRVTSRIDVGFFRRIEVDSTSKISRKIVESKKIKKKIFFL